MIDSGSDGPGLLIASTAGQTAKAPKTRDIKTLRPRATTRLLQKHRHIPYCRDPRKQPNEDHQGGIDPRSTAQSTANIVVHINNALVV